jgi:hypothetical protein
MVLKKALILVSAAWMTGAIACVLVISTVVRLACHVCGAIPCSASGREVIASACLSGIPSRMKTVHQLQISRQARHDLTAFSVLRGKSRPRPLVLQFVEVVLRIPAVAIELRLYPYCMDVTSTSYS